MEREIVWMRSDQAEDAEGAAVIVGFDPDDPQSVRRARAAIQDALGDAPGLHRALPLCLPRRRGRLARLARAVRRAVRRG